MNKFLLPLLLLLGAAACSEKSLYPDAAKAFEKHSYQEFPPGKVMETLQAKGFAGLAALDSRATLIQGRRPVRQRQGKAALSSGLLVGYRRGSMVALKVFQNSPAAAAGFKDGDKLTEIDGLPASPQAVAEHMNDSFGFNLKAERRGPKGAAPAAAQVKRDDFIFPLIFGFYEPASETAYVKIGLFVQDSSSTVLAGLEALTSLGAKKIVFDLRDNLGGVPEEAAGLLAAFAPKAGPVLELRSRHKGYSRVFEARGRGKYADLRTAVLVDGTTAMAAEVFAQALKELAGAKIIGTGTEGRVSVIRTFRLGKGPKGLELTVARLFPPSGVDLEGVGLAPDVKTEVTREQEKDMREAWGASSEMVLLGDRAYDKSLEILSK
jgi:carboxyl-terminal processing protease